MPLSVTLTVGGVDYAAYVRLASLEVRASVRDRAGTLSFEAVIPYSGTTPAIAVPRAGREVVLTVAGTLEFGGVVQRVTEVAAGSSSYAYAIDCADYVRWFDRYLVQGVKIPDGDAEGITDAAGDIVREIVSGTCNQGPITWGVAGVEDGPDIPQQVFDFEAPSSAIDRIAKAVGYAWYLDHDRSVVFRATTGAAAAAPTAAVTWETQTVLGDLSIAEAADQIINVAYLKDAKSVATLDDGTAAAHTETVGTGDGYSTFYGLGYEPATYDGVTVTVTPTSGSPSTYTTGNGGLLRENIDGKPGDGQARDKALLCLPNWGVRFETPPASGSRVTVTYPYLDIVPRVNRIVDAASITEVRDREGASVSDGTYEEAFAAGDLVNVSQAAVKARAATYLATRSHRWAATAVTYQAGWRPGQVVRVTSDRRFGGLFAAGVDLYVTDTTRRFATPDTWATSLVLSSDAWGEL